MKSQHQSDEVMSNFNKEGFIPAIRYIEDIERMESESRWKLPLSLSDRFNLFSLKIFLRLFRLRNMLYILHPYTVSPSYLLLVKYLETRNFFDIFEEKEISIEGYFAFRFMKSVTVQGISGKVFSGGVSTNKEEAFSKAVGELVERMVSGVYDKNTDIHIDSVTHMSARHPVFYPPKYHRLLEVQKKKHASYFGQETRPLRWVSGLNLITKEKTYIPKLITSWFTGDLIDKELVFNATTNGAAGYFTKEGAVLRGLLEYVQRDAFLVHWLTSIPPFRIKEATLPSYLQEKMKKFEIKGNTLYILDMTALPIPSVCVVTVNDKALIPQITVAASTAATVEKAIDEALDETAKMLEGFTVSNVNRKLEIDNLHKEPFISNMGMDDRRRYWRGGDKLKEFQWFVSGEEITYEYSCEKNLKNTTEDDISLLSECLSILKKLGESYYPIVYFPKNDIQNRLGFYVAQVYIPKAFPLYLIEKYGTFDSDRLHEFALSKNKKDWSLNTLPHPFF